MSATSQQITPTQVTTSSTSVVEEPSFTELVYAHYAWWRKRHNGKAADADATYRDVLRRFENHNGRLVDSFWCSNLESGIALTEQKRPFPFQPRLRFHRESDWATKQSPLIATELHRCDELAIRARTVLTGVRQRICLHLVTASAAHLLSLVDAATAPSTNEDTVAALEHERDALKRAERYYRHAANGQAQILYFAGMVTVAVLISVATLLFLTIDEWRVGVAALVAGAVGAVVSVVQRINAGGFQVEYDVGRPYAFFLGGLRPLIGGAFAIAIAFTFSSGILHLPITDGKDHERLGLVVVSFLAGFSERWAQDTLTTALPQQSPQPTQGPAAEAPEPAGLSEHDTA